MLRLSSERKKLVNTGKQIGKAISSIMLIAALMLPSAIQFSHIFKGHGQVDCKEQSTHFHKEVQDCDICHFHFTYCDYTISSYSDVACPVPQGDSVIEFSPLVLHSFKFTNTQLRAPPLFLS